MDWSSEEGRALLRAAYAGVNVRGLRTLSGLTMSGDDGLVIGIDKSVLGDILDEDPDALLPIPDKSDRGSWAILLSEFMSVVGVSLEGAHLYQRPHRPYSLPSSRGWVLRGFDNGLITLPLVGAIGDSAEIAIVSAHLFAREQAAASGRPR